MARFRYRFSFPPNPPPSAKDETNDSRGRHSAAAEDGTGCAPDLRSNPEWALAMMPRRRYLYLWMTGGLSCPFFLLARSMEQGATTAEDQLTSRPGHGDVQ